MVPSIPFCHSLVPDVSEAYDCSGERVFEHRHWVSISYFE